MKQEHFYPGNLETYSKAELFNFFRDSAQLDQDELNHLLVELATRLQTEMDKGDKFKCVLLACSHNQQLAQLGISMLKEFAGSPDDIKYWLAVYEIAREASGPRSLANAESYLRLMKLTQSKNQEELQVALQQLRTEYQATILFAIGLKGS